MPSRRSLKRSVANATTAVTQLGVSSGVDIGDIFSQFAGGSDGYYCDAETWSIFCVWSMTMLKFLWIDMLRESEGKCRLSLHTRVLIQSAYESN